MEGRTAVSQVQRGSRISVEGIRHGYAVSRESQVVRALWDFDLAIEPGEFVSVVGPSGCGKTTLLSLVGGLEQPRSGRVLIDGKPVTGPSSSVAYMQARDALFPWRTVRKNVEFGLEVMGVRKAERHRESAEWLRRVGLSDFENWPVLKLSQGMRQRVAIARTLVLHPTCVLMDEPFAALDAQTRVVLQQEFLRLWADERPTILFITHDLPEAVLLSDRVVVMSYRPGQVLKDVRIELPRPRALEAELGDDLFRSYMLTLGTSLRSEVQRGLRNTLLN
jgi:NitT/TauT family transport system ATP-binding protein